jgi:hypothetical protein
MEKKRYRCLPVAEFMQNAEKLRSRLLSGDLNDILRLDTKTAVYETMSQKGDLWLRLVSTD